MMSTVAVAVSTPKGSFITKLDTDLVAVGKKIKEGLEDAGEDAVKVAAFLASNQGELQSLAALGGAGATKITGIGLTLTNLAINAVKDAAAAGSADGLKISLDQTVEADVKELIAAIEKV